MANLPLPHTLHGLSGLDENLPTAQAVHWVAPLAPPVSVTEPAAHVVQLVTPSLEYVPAGQREQDDCPLAACSRPDGHASHVVAPSNG